MSTVELLISEWKSKAHCKNRTFFSFLMSMFITICKRAWRSPRLLVVLTLMVYGNFTKSPGSLKWKQRCSLDMLIVQPTHTLCRNIRLFSPQESLSKSPPPPRSLERFTCLFPISKQCFPLYLPAELMWFIWRTQVFYYVSMSKCFSSQSQNALVLMCVPTGPCVAGLRRVHGPGAGLSPSEVLL